MNKQTLRQLFVARQNLNKRMSGKSSYLDLLDKIGCIQIDPVSVVNPNLNLVAFNRLAQFNADDYVSTLRNHNSFEYFANAMCNIHSQYAEGIQLILEHKANNRLHERVKYQQQYDSILNQIKQTPLRAIDIECEGTIANNWSGLKSRKLTSYLLEVMLETGEVTVVDRINGHKVYGVAWLNATTDFERNYEALFNLYLRSRTVIPANKKIPWLKGHKEQFFTIKDKQLKNGVIEEVDLDGNQFLIQAVTDANEHKIGEHLRFLSPLDNLLWDRKLISELFEYDYKWEIYTPQTERKYGPYSMPILYNAKIIGEISFIKENAELKVLNGVIKRRYYRSDIVGKKMSSELVRLASFLGLNARVDFWDLIAQQ